MFNHFQHKKIINKMCTAGINLVHPSSLWNPYKTSLRKLINKLNILKIINLYNWLNRTTTNQIVRVYKKRRKSSVRRHPIYSASLSRGGVGVSLTKRGL